MTNHDKSPSKGNSQAGGPPPVHAEKVGSPDTAACIPLAMNVADGFTVTAVGDLIIKYPESMRRDFAEIVNILKNADVTFGNFENTAFDFPRFQAYPQAEAGGSWLLSAPTVTNDVRSMGFTVMSRANNHATDWGVEGMLETNRLLDRAGIIHAGTGKTRAAARDASYLQTSQGNIGLVAISSSFTSMSRSMSPLGLAPGRPGVNALRTRRLVLVTAEQMRVLRTIRNSIPAGLLDPTLPEPTDNELELCAVHYRVGNHPGFSYEMDAIDLNENLASIRLGKERSDFLIVSMHAHEPTIWSRDVPDFLPILARTAIDNGADMFIGHGPHRLRGIEIYQGKPIFYSLGNFFFEQDQQYPIVADMWEQFKLDPATMTEAEFVERRRKKRFHDEEFYQSVIAVNCFAKGQLSEIRLYPVDLSSDRGSRRGVPRLAAPEIAQKILKLLRKLSDPFGTTIKIDGNIGVIQVLAGNGSDIAAAQS